jgi:hypothetical protein
MPGRVKGGTRLDHINKKIHQRLANKIFTIRLYEYFTCISVANTANTLHEHTKHDIPFGQNEITRKNTVQHKPKVADN